MSTIHNVRLWDDPGYTEGCISVPGIYSQLPTPTHSYYVDFNPPREALFSSINIPAPYLDLLNSSYIAITLSMNSGAEKEFYGWIDKVSIVSDSLNQPVTKVEWHIDYWRTYLPGAVFEDGIVTRRPPSANQPPQDYPYRYMLHGAEVPLVPITESLCWFYWTMGVQDGDLTRINTYAMPIYYLNESQWIWDVSGTYHGITLAQLEGGFWDEMLEINPSTIYSAFISPCPPNKFTLDKTDASKWKLSLDGCLMHNFGEAYCAWHLTRPPKELSFTGANYTTNDDVVYVITGFDCETVGELPWGLPLGEYKYRMVIDSSAAYVQIRKGKYGHVEGRCWTIPCPPIPVGDNSLSAYVYSGAREADINQRAADTDRKLVESITSSTVSTGIMGSFNGGAIGAALGATAGIASAGISAAYDQQFYNDQIQDIQDKYAVAQPDGLLMSGAGLDWIRNGQTIMLRGMHKDQYSKELHDKEVELYGIKCSESTDDCSALISRGGPLRISNLNVKGDIPVEAKRYFRDRFNGGVRIE